MRVPVVFGLTLPMISSSVGRFLRVRLNGASGDGVFGIGVGIYAWMTLVEGHVMGFAVAVDLDVQTRAQRVDDGRADAVQAAGRVIGRVAELRAGMQLGQHDLDAGELGLRLDVDGDATAVVGHFHGAVVVQGHR